MTTSADIIYQRRVQLLDLAEQLGNISKACRLMGISRTRYYEWARIVEQYGLEALMPKDRRRSQQPNETPTHVVADLLAVAVVEPETLELWKQHLFGRASNGIGFGKPAWYYLTTWPEQLLPKGLQDRAR